MASIFTKIINGEIPCYKVAENERCFAFLDINPLVKGHTLVVPKKEVDYIYDLDDNYLSDLFIFSKRVAKAIEKTITCQRIGIAVIGLEIPHAHIHLVPLIDGMNNINFSNPKLKLSDEEMSEIASNIRKAYNQ
jgi:histidine triad (HIT) family protein